MLFLCWVVYVGFYYYYGFKCEFKLNKLSGVFIYKSYFDYVVFICGFDDIFLVLYFCYGYIDIDKIIVCDDLVVLVGFEWVGVYLIKNKFGS